MPTDRFDGKKVIECQVSDGINKTEELVKRIAAGDAPVFKASGKKEASHSSIGGKESIGHQIYKHLMNGVSAYASVRSWWWYPYRNRVPYRWIQC